MKEIKKETVGLVFSTLSNLYSIPFILYFTYLIIFELGEFTILGLILIGGPGELISLLVANSAVYEYKKSNNKSEFRKIMNSLNIMHIIIVILFVIICSILSIL